MIYQTEYAPLMKRLIALFPQRPINAETIAAYWELLGDLDGDAFAQAVKHCGTTCEWFPTVKQLREAAERTPAGIRARNSRHLSIADPDEEAEREAWLAQYRPSKVSAD